LRFGPAFARVREWFFARPRSGKVQRAFRSLRLDFLEERALLSVSPLTLDAVLVNQTFGLTQATTTANSVAMANDGDFVVAWSRQDPVLDSAGNPVLDANGNPETQSNVYARYFTQEVQRLTLPGPGSVNANGQVLPQGIATNFDNDPNTVGHFTLEYDAQTQMQISVTAGTAPAGDATPPISPTVQGQFTLWFDANGNGQVDPGETYVVDYNENTPALNAAQIQGWLNKFGPVYNPVTGAEISDGSHAVVTAIDPQDYLVDFGTQTQGVDQSQLLQYLGPNSPAAVAAGLNPAFNLSGFLPAVSVTTLDRPFLIPNIPVSQTDPNQTVQAIETYFQQPGASFTSGESPFAFPPPDRVGDSEAPYVAPVASSVNQSLTATPVQGFNVTVTAQPVLLTNPGGQNSDSYTQFDITFTGVSGDRDEPPLKVVSCSDENGVAIDPTTYADVSILKESTPEFRVNPVVPANPFLLNPQVLNSDQAAVAMSPAGNFVVTWRGDVSQLSQPKDVTDVYARMYAPVGITDSYNPGTYVPGQMYDAAGDPICVRQIIAPTTVDQQQLVFTATGALPVQGNFELQLGSVTTASIYFDSTSPTNTAADIQAKLQVGFNGATVTYVPPSVQPANQTQFTFDVAFGGASTGVDEPPIQLVQLNPPLPVNFAQTDITPDKYTLAVNVDYTNPQFDPVVAMDQQGDFNIAFANQGMDVSYFNNIMMQRFDRYGNLLGPEITVDTETTSIETLPSLVMSPDGLYSVVAWTHTDDPAYVIPNQPYYASALARVYDQNVAVNNQFFVGGGGNTSVSMDSGDNYTISWENSGVITNPNGTVTPFGEPDDNGQVSSGVYAREFELVNPATNQPIACNDPDSSSALALGGTGSMGNQLIRDIFRINSGAPNGNAAGPYPSQPNPTFVYWQSQTAAPATWPYEQTLGDVKMAASGDIAGTYQGYLPDASDDVDIPASFFQPYFRQVEANGTVVKINQDLLPYFNPFPSAAYPQGEGLDPLGFTSTLYQNGDPDVDTAIDQILYNAAYNPPLGTPAATDEQLGRLREILEGVAGMLRGDSDGIGLTQFDAAPSNTVAGAVEHATYSDSIASTTRSGTNQRYYIEIPGDVDGGSFQITLYIGATMVGQKPLTNPNQAPLSNLVAQPDPDVGTWSVTVTINLNPSDGAPSLANPTGIMAAAVRQSWATDIQNALATALGGITGGNWPVTEVGTGNQYNQNPGTVDVRIVPGPNDTAAGQVDEVLARQGTDWQIPGINIGDFHADQGIGFHGATLYEVDFQGEAHDVPIAMQVSGSTTLAWNAVVDANGNVTFTLTGAASSPVAIDGDYNGAQGTQQYNASLAMDAPGNMVVAYTQQPRYTDGSIPADASGNYTDQNIYVEQLAESTDTAGPHVVDWTDGNGTSLLYATTQTGVAAGVNAQYFVVVFDEPMFTGDWGTNTVNPNQDSVLNPANYEIEDGNGNLISNAVVHVDYGMSELAQVAGQYQLGGSSAVPSDKYEAVLTLDGDPNTPGDQPLPDGTYTLIVKAAASSTTGTAQNGLRNIYGTPLGLSGYYPAGQNFTATVTIHSSTNVATNPTSPGSSATDRPISGNQPGNQIDPVVANSPNGSYVVAWTSTVGAQTQIVAQLYNAKGTLVQTISPVNTFTTGNETRPSVAMDANGDFVVVWSGAGPDTNATTNTSNVFYRLFNAQGQAAGSQRQANVYEGSTNIDAHQDEASVAMAADGTFTITWTSFGQPATAGGANQVSAAVFYRQFDATGAPMGPTANMEAMVNTASSNRQGQSDVAMDNNDDFVVVWTAYTQSGTAANIDGRYYNHATGQFGAQFQVNVTTVQQGYTDANGFFGAGAPLDLWATGPRVSMDDSSGSFVATWANYQASSATGYEVFARQFASGGGAKSNEFLVENNPPDSGPGWKAGWQLMPDVGVGDDGSFIIVWTSFGEDNQQLNHSSPQDYGIYAKEYNNAGTIIVPQFRVNATTVGDQVAPSVDEEASNDNAIIAWVGPSPQAVNGIPTAIFDRVVDAPSSGAPAKPVPTTTRLTTSAATITAGQSVTFTATVAAAGSGPTGTVTFKNGSSVLGTATLSAGAATLTTSGLPAGSDSITASYSGSTTCAASTSAALTETVNQPAAAATTTTLATSAATVTAGQSVTFTATVKAASGTPTGTVTFKNGSTVLGSGTLSGGTASFATSSLPVGSDSITATYAGTTTFATSTSAALTETVKQATGTTATTTTLAASAATITSGQSVTFTATVKAASGTPTGTVTFKSGSTVLGSGTLSGGTASFSTSSLPVGSDSITATYAGTTTFATSTSAALTETVKQATGTTATTTTLAASAATITSGQSVTFTATVKAASGTPTGTVTFKNGSTVLGSGTLSGGTASFTTSSLPVGSDSITATYAGTTSFATSSSAALTETVKQAASAAATTTSLTTSATSSVYGQTVIFTATVKSGSPSAAVTTGSVTFKDGSSVIKTVALNSSGQALWVAATLPVAAHTITASYVATASFAASTSNSVTDTVSQALTSISLTASPTSVASGASVTFTATLKIAAPSGTSPAGWVVTFKDGSTVLGTATTNAGGVATLQTSTLPAGTDPITVSFAGNTNLKGCTSSTISEVVSNSTKSAVKTSLAPAAVDMALLYAF
jgi:hypothetical protein